MWLESVPASISSRPAALPLDPTSPGALFERIGKFVVLDAADRAALSRLTRHRKRFLAHDVLIHVDRTPDKVCLLLNGLAVRYRYLVDGRRQVFGYLLPGDLCDTHFVITHSCDHSIALLCDADIAVISPAELMTTMVEHPRVERALLMMVLVESAILRESLLNLGQRDAYERLAHFFCEIAARLEDVGMGEVDGCLSLPLTQNDLADTMGLTVVHVSRVLKRLRDEGMLCWSRKRVTILDRARLEVRAEFSDRYLRLGPCPAEPRLCAYG